MLFAESGSVKLADFGYAKHVGLLGRTTTTIGTTGYKAPEVLRAKPDAPYGPECDIFSLGCTAVLLATCEHLFASDAAVLQGCHKRGTPKLEAADGWQFFAARATERDVKTKKPTTDGAALEQIVSKWMPAKAFAKGKQMLQKGLRAAIKSGLLGKERKINKGEEEALRKVKMNEKITAAFSEF